LALSFSCTHRTRWWMRRLSQFVGIDLSPLALISTDEISTSSSTIDARILGAGRRDTLVAQRTRRHQKPPARTCDHPIRRRQVLQFMVDDRSHAFGDRLVLQVNAVNAAIDAAVLRVRQKLVAAARPPDRRTVLVGGLRQGHR
jgi:hypothetical protein